ncbi:hypothetical protein MTBGP_21560 [Moorella thermoacetica]
MESKEKRPPTSREDRILKPEDFPQGKIGSAYMATIAGQPAIRDVADEEEEEDRP